jgi:hypothetical protein
MQHRRDTVRIRLRFVFHVSAILLLLAAAYLIWQWRASPEWVIGADILPLVLGFLIGGVLLLVVARRAPALDGIRIAVGASWALTVVLLGAMLFMLVRGCLAVFPPVPSDDELIARFTQHRTDFERLAGLLDNESYLRIVNPDSGCLTIDRVSIDEGQDPLCDQYMRLFRTLGLHWAYVDGPPVYLTVYAEGLLPGIRKGYMYAPDPSGILGAWVDDTQIKGVGSPRFNEFDDGWFIFLW